MPWPLVPAVCERVCAAVDQERLVDLAARLVDIPSPTRSCGPVADALAAILADDGFDVQRCEAGWPEAPAVVARFDSGSPGRTLQFNGHLDTVHLPFVPARVENGCLRGSGASDMKGGIAAMCEAMRVLRDTGLLRAGSILLTAHDLHESPWGDGSQIDGLIRAGFVGDGVLLPEYVADRLPVIGRGLAVLRVRAWRPGSPVHEVLGGAEQPNVIAAGAETVRRLLELDRRLAVHTHPLGGRDSLFVGQIEAGEIFNQSPIECRLAGTRRWLPGGDAGACRREFEQLLAETARDCGVQIDGEFIFVRDAFELPPADPLIPAFQAASQFVNGHELPAGAKPFVDDGNTFSAQAQVAAITHGPDATGAHTVHESAPVSELVRVARVYALTALGFCDAQF